MNQSLVKSKTAIKGDTPVFFSGVRYGKIPLGLLKDSTVKAQSKALFAAFFSVCKHTSLEMNPVSLANQSEFARWFGVSQASISSWLRDLEQSGWATRIQVGLGVCNIVILHDRRGKKIAHSTVDRYKKSVKEYFHLASENFNEYSDF